MAKNQYTISLTSGQRRTLRRIINSDSAPAFKVKNARILLNTDSGKGGAKRSDQAIAREFNLSTNAIERVQKRFLERGLEITVNQRLQAKDTDIQVKDAPNKGTVVDFGVGNVTVNPDGSTFIKYPGGSVTVNLNGGIDGKGVVINDSNTGVNIASGLTDIVFPGGSATFELGKGWVVNYPGGKATYDPASGLVVEYPGGGASYSFTKGGIVQFPGGEVNFGLNGVTTNLSSANNTFG
jgi:hypothetical protein